MMKVLQFKSFDVAVSLTIVDLASTAGPTSSLVYYFLVFHTLSQQDPNKIRFRTIPHHKDEQAVGTSLCK